MTKILIINGPNLNVLHLRNKEIYGNFSLDKIAQDCQNLAKEIKAEVVFFQSNNEGEIIDAIHQAINKFAGIIINPAGFTHSSVAIRDALEIFGGKKIEIHLSNIYKREEFRQHSYVSGVVDGVISGLGAQVYSLALLAINQMIDNK
jgi:3-dehydroquinate dehydratase-2